MVKKTIAVIVLASICTAVSAAEPTKSGFDAGSVNQWLSDHGYDRSPTEAEADQKRRAAILGDNSDVLKRMADVMVQDNLDRVNRLLPKFNSYPLYLQVALLNADSRIELDSPINHDFLESIQTDDFKSAADHYHAQPLFAESENYFAAKDAYDAMPDKDSPAGRDLLATKTKYQSHQGDRPYLQQMQVNELAFLRFARENDIDRTWKRATVLGSEGFAVGSPADFTSAYGANKGLTVADYNDYLNRQNRGNQPIGGASAPAAAPFTFTVPNSTNGFSDITVNRKTPFTFTLLDRHIVDGDIQTVTFVNGRGSQVNQTITLTSGGQAFTVRAAKGANELRLFAQNQGSLGVNSGGLRIGSPVVTGAADQDVSLLTGQTGILRVTGR